MAIALMTNLAVTNAVDVDGGERLGAWSGRSVQVTNHDESPIVKLELQLQ